MGDKKNEECLLRKATAKTNPWGPQTSKATGVGLHNPTGVHIRICGPDVQHGTTDLIFVCSTFVLLWSNHFYAPILTIYSEIDLHHDTILEAHNLLLIFVCVCVWRGSVFYRISQLIVYLESQGL